MFLHLLSDEKFIDFVIAKFETIIPDQSIYLIPTSDSSLKHVGSKHHNIIVTSTDSDIFKNITGNLSQYKAVFIHNLFDDYKKVIVLKDQTHAYFHWMSWGTDLYSISQLNTNLILPYTRKTISLRRLPVIFFKIHSALIQNSEFYRNYHVSRSQKNNIEINTTALFKKITSFSTVIPEEKSLIHRHLNSNLKYIPFKYASIEDSLQLDIDMVCTGNHFLIGNSATPTNNHLDVFYILSKSKLPPIVKIITPLSYGDQHYARLVMKKGLQLFDKQFHPLTDFLKANEFNRILDECGNVVMNHIRQQALGTILISLWKGARVFMNEKNPVYFYLKSQGIELYPLSSIKKLKHLPSNQYLAQVNRPILIKLYSEETILNNIRNLLLEIESIKKSLHETYR